MVKPTIGKKGETMNTKKGYWDYPRYGYYENEAKWPDYAELDVAPCPRCGDMDISPGHRICSSCLLEIQADKDEQIEVVCASCGVHFFILRYQDEDDAIEETEFFCLKCFPDQLPDDN
jgi:hypothetical protein